MIKRHNNPTNVLNHQEPPRTMADPVHLKIRTDPVTPIAIRCIHLLSSTVHSLPNKAFLFCIYYLVFESVVFMDSRVLLKKKKKKKNAALFPSTVTTTKDMAL
ncbi:hypothetical protein HMI54_008903 [Coelomomyces lativittatus]|nr:hypothetical protein HMI54_008903 [Coelomomyces lativittatus]